MALDGRVRAGSGSGGDHFPSCRDFPLSAPEIRPFAPGEGWPDFAQHIQQARQQSRPDLLIANDYAPPAMMQFYLPDHPVTYLPPAPYGETQFTLWPGYKVRHGTRALYVSDSRGPLPQQLKAQFSRWELLDDFWSQYHGRATTHFQIYLLTKD